jgi:hypothetical protein
VKIAVYAFCTALGYLLAQALPDGPLAAYVPMLISYHLFLIFLVISSQKKSGLSLPILHAAVTHLAFLAVLIGCAYAREHVPFFSLVRMFIPSLAPFETKWLFEGKDGKPAAEADAKPVVSSATAEEYEEFRNYLSRGERRFRAVGVSVAEEFELWRTARAKLLAARVEAAKLQA